MLLVRVSLVAVMGSDTQGPGPLLDGLLPCFLVEVTATSQRTKISWHENHDSGTGSPPG